MKYSIISILLLVFLAGLLPAESPKAFTINDLYRIRYCSPPQVSPDGQTLLFTLSTSHLETGRRSSHLYRMHLPSKRLDQLTASKAADFAPFWSEDGKTIYFQSTREGGVQLWALPAEGGEPRKISAYEPGLGQVLAHGSRVLFTSSLYPDVPFDSAKQTEAARQHAEGPIKAIMADHLLYRHWNAYREDRYQHLLWLDLKTGKVTPLTQGQQDYPSTNLGGGAGFDINPKTGDVCVVSHADPNDANATNSDLFLFDAKTGQSRNITGEQKAYDGQPLFSPDGRLLAYGRQTVPGYESDRKKLVIRDLSSGKEIEILEKEQQWVENWIWSPDSRYLYVTLPSNGYSPLFRVNARSGATELILDNWTPSSLSLDPRGKTLYFTHSRINEPQEIWALDLGSRKPTPRRLTSFNEALRQEVDIRPAESLYVQTPQNRSIQVFIVKPHDFDPHKRYPLIMNVHGGPQMQWSDTFRGDWHVYPGAGYIVAFPNPTGSTGYGQAFTEGISKDWDGKVMEDIMAVADHLAELPYVDKDRMGAMGWSWGGYAMMWLEGHNPGRFKALAAMMGIYDLPSFYGATEELWFPTWDIGGTPWENPDAYARPNPSGAVKNFATPCLVITGEKDYRVPYTQSLQFFTALQQRQVPSRLIVFPEDGHWPHQMRAMPVYYNAHLEWFHQFLGGEPAPWKTSDLVRNRAFDEKKAE